MISVRRASIRAGDFQLQEVCLEVPTGQYGMLMGRTGGGKTTILEAVAGLRKVTAGQIYLRDRDVTDCPPALRRLGYVPQDGALFATMSVRDHLAFALRIRHRPRAQIDARVSRLARLLEIEPLLKRGIAGLSGGERQRVAIGRALAAEPDTLLLDEPLSALDDDTRQQMYELLKHVQQETQVTTLHVTHHGEDVRQLADIVFRVKDGAVQQVDAHRAPESL